MIASGLGRVQAQDPVDEWIAACDRKSSFIDIGGIGEDSTNERVTWAAKCGFERVAMADLEGPDHRLWSSFEQQMIRVGSSASIERFYHVNIDDPSIGDSIGRWSFVHSTGILYHCPNPIHSILNFRHLSPRDLVINTVIVPRIVENDLGRLELPASGALFTPGLSGDERLVLGRHYQQKWGLDIEQLAPRMESQAEAIMPYIASNGGPSYYPYWWLFTANSFESAARLLKMEIVDTWTWENHAHFVWLQSR